MTFLYPLGLLGLIGIPIIIVIYLLKNKYNEQTVTSTYLWTLSERFYKKRNPLSRFIGLLGLILQILTVAIISLAIARPIITIPESAGEYCFVIDCSGSMNMTDGKESSFERAKGEIEDIIDDAKSGSTYTLITLSDEAVVLYERLTDKDLAIDVLSDVKCTDTEADYSAALEQAQRYFDENPSFLVYLFTDKEVVEHKNLEVVNVGLANAENYAISDALGTLTDGELITKATVESFNSDATLEVELYVDGKMIPSAKKAVSVSKGEPCEIELSARVDSFSSFRLRITNKDCLDKDNEIISYNLESESSYSILVVSENPFFIEAALDALTDTVVDTVSPDEYGKGGNYGLYIFDSFTPTELPDAAVWLINSSKSVDNSGFGIRGVIELSEPMALEKSNSTSTAARTLLSGIDGRNIFISEFIKYSGMYTKFTTLFSYDMNPIIFAGTNALGNREVVIGFDLHKADFSLSTDFVPLLGSLLEYSCPDLIDRSYFVAGDEANVNITANVTNVKATAPDGESLYVDAKTDIGVIRLDKVGTYTVTVNYPNESKTLKIYSSFPTEESDPSDTLETFSLSGERKYERSDGEFDPIAILLILLAVLFTADWMVYCYEKYQLR